MENMFSEPDLDKRSTLLDFATEALRNAILNEEVKPGERVNEITFTNKLGISRTTFREALRQMEQVGLLVRIPFRGTFVREYSEEEIQDLNNLRGVLETYAAEIIIQNGDNQPEKLLPLYQLAAQMEGVDPQKEAARINDLQITFHRTLLNLAGSRLFLTAWDNLAQQFWVAMRISQLSALARGKNLNLAEAHRAVADAIASGNVNRTREVIHEHVFYSFDTPGHEGA